MDDVQMKTALGAIVTKLDNLTTQVKELRSTPTSTPSTASSQPDVAALGNKLDQVLTVAQSEAVKQAAQATYDHIEAALDWAGREEIKAVLADILEQYAESEGQAQYRQPEPVLAIRR